MNKSLLPTFIMSVALLVSACSNKEEKYIYVLDSCSWVRIIYLTDHDIDVLDRQTKRDILAHNKSVQANCLTKPTNNR
ncbi:hypothetical protein [Klebsiella spallanzanii]|uniref:Lipoprotein n=1 Tax=Klebsiella spallanzanii TaxID=2587528 RepID=A0A564HW98_9ENTR|nr:hypothetical protein SB6408_03211 [Klebsiella spallanzanii]HAT1562048.1 hypothetical protein [Raoultella ornithinolytica]